MTDQPTPNIHPAEIAGLIKSYQGLIKRLFLKRVRGGGGGRCDQFLEDVLFGVKKVLVDLGHHGNPGKFFFF